MALIRSLSGTRHPHEVTRRYNIIRSEAATTPKREGENPGEICSSISS